MFRAQKVEGNIGLVTDYPTIVAGPDVKQISRSHLVVAAVFHSASGAPGHNHPDVFHLAERRTGRSSNMFRPFPSRLVARATDHHRSVTFWNMSVLAQLSDEIVVFLVRANPKPDREIAVSLRKSAIVISDS